MKQLLFFSSILFLFYIFPINSSAQLIASGYAHNLSVCIDSTVRAWGRNDDRGQLGDGTFTNRSVPVRVKYLNGITAVAAGSAHSLALKNDSTVWAWGMNYYGELGDGTRDTTGCLCKNNPVQVSSLTGIVAIAAGGGYSLALKNDGTVWAWGTNGKGQLGNGTTADSSIPVQVSGLTDMIAIVSGEDHSLALKNDSTVWAWGRNHLGQLGDGTTNPTGMCQCKTAPVQASGLTEIVSIEAGGIHSLVVKNDGSLWSWGGNVDGQLANGNTTNSSVPVQSGILTGITAIGAGANHTLVAKNDGTIWACGSNNYGQLGNGTYDSIGSIITPVQTIGLNGIITALAGNLYHSLARKSDGSLWTWGYNQYGEAGNGVLGVAPYFRQSFPVQVKFMYCGKCVPPTTDVVSSDAACYNECNGQAIANASGGNTPFAYSWNNGANDSTNTNLCATEYFVTVTDSMNCPFIDSATIAEPPLIANSVSATICSNDSIFLQGNYQTAVGIYYDTLAAANGCDSVITTNLTVYSAYNASVTTAICSGNSIFLQGNYQATAGTYYDTLSSVNGCDSVITTTLTVNSTYSIPTTAAICSDDSILLQGSYQITAGTYTDALTTVNGCDSIITTALTVNPLPTVPAITSNGTTLTSSSAIGNQWFLNDTLIPGDTSQNNIVTRNGNYVVVVTDSNGCSSVSAPYNFTTISVDELNAIHPGIIIPNPNSGHFRVNLNNIQNIKIINVLGEMIFESENKILEIDLSTQPKGIYSVLVTTHEKSYCKKLIIQ